ncbi:beta-mannosidase [Streptohalobacillus salinus]|uniref:Beta-mannosidase B n=1 Tax=Streptohalobacillus salinus TaxID=621096 RepID=A0A2V3WCA3_9BACI|nr:glycoside hydrolase family 2 protein [Streptohalobacillus salinus]PXW92205.1 beta-mannosidase [Streptohalobacillus salinus]
MIREILQDWLFKDKESETWLAADVPGSVQTDLYKQGKIKDPFYGDNERDLQWIDKKDWQYETQFQLTNQQLRSQCQLVFHGLDTYTTIYLNNQLLLETDNMFRTYTVDINALAKTGNNHLCLEFRSPIKEDLPKLTALGYQLPAANDDSEMGEIGDKKLSVFARKAPYHYGWDWGPRFVTSGIYQPVELLIFNDARLTDVAVDQRKVEASEAVVSAQFEADIRVAGQYKFTVKTEGIEATKTVSLPVGKHRVALAVTINQPKRWYSHDLGDPHRYAFDFYLEENDRMLDHVTKKIGLRKVKLIQTPDSFGKSFYIELNDLPVFIKGANHIPNDSFINEVTDDKYRKEIKDALFANMNMLRVWGGGVYEADIFYDLCDAAGIMVWQDFMFACSMYPGDDAFLNNVASEAEDQLKRLRHHPSIVLWCGNNEIDSAWAHYDENGGWGWKQAFTAGQREQIWNDYLTIFHGILKEKTAELVPREPYWPSSPMREVTNNEAQHALKATGAGDVHYWDVWHGKQPFEAYRDHVGRFMSEYGFQSFPEKATVDQFLTEKDYQIDSDYMLHHQKNGDGNHLIETYLSMYLPKPKDFPSFLYLSQVLQADAMKMAIEAHRERMPYCMGTLYWQINDCWPVASWSSVDYYGRYKALHYQVKRSYQELLLTAHEADGTIEVHGINDRQKTVHANLTYQLMSFSGEVVVGKSEDVNLLPQSSTSLIKLKRADLLSKLDPERHVLALTLKSNTETLAEQRHLFTRTKDLAIKQGEVTLKQSSEGHFFIKSNVYQRALYLMTDVAGHFSDNFFDLLPNEEKMITFHADDPSSNPTITIKQMAEMIE